jgi:hypothetical protein
MKTFYRILSWYDAYWRRKNRVEKFDDLLSFSFKKYSGKRQIMEDDTWVEPGDCVAIIHFNRECFDNSSTDPKKILRNALRFRRLIIKSFKQLAIDVSEGKKFAHVKAFHGISWLPPHGEKLGFVIEKVPDSILNSIRKFYFSILLKTFFPNITMREINSIEPHAYWLTRQTLLNNFVAGKMTKESETNQEHNPDVAGVY